MLKEAGARMHRLFMEFSSLEPAFIMEMERMIRLAIYILSLLPEEYRLWRLALMNLLPLGIYMACSGGVLQGMFSLRLSLEAAIQLHYLAWESSRQGSAVSSLLEEYSRRGRAFTLKMIRSVPGIPGVYRKQLARVYLKLTHMTHPSELALSIASNNSGIHPPTILELVRDVLDFIIYLILHHVPRDKLSSIPHDTLAGLGFQRSLKYLIRILKGKPS